MDLGDSVRWGLVRDDLASVLVAVEKTSMAMLINLLRRLCWSIARIRKAKKKKGRFWSPALPLVRFRKLDWICYPFCFLCSVCFYPTHRLDAIHYFDSVIGCSISIRAFTRNAIHRTMPVVSHTSQESVKSFRSHKSRCHTFQNIRIVAIMQRYHVAVLEPWEIAINLGDGILMINSDCNMWVSVQWRPYQPCEGR